MNFEIPEPLKAEHDELHAELVRATRAGGRIGEAARAVAALMHPHFVKEEEFALPPLGLLPRIAAGEVTADMADVVRLTDRLKADLPDMLAEHKQIVEALETLVAAAKEAKKPKIAAFAEKLMLHARMEEEVMYPAAVLIGEHVKARLGSGAL